MIFSLIILRPLPAGGGPCGNRLWSIHLVFHLSLCFVPAYFKFDSIIDGFIKRMEACHAGLQEDWLKGEMNTAEEEQEECVEAERIVNQESRDWWLSSTASNIFWFRGFCYMLWHFITLFRHNCTEEFLQTISECQGSGTKGIWFIWCLM